MHLNVDLLAAGWEAESVEYKSLVLDLATALTRGGHRVSLRIRRTGADLPDTATTRAGVTVRRVSAGPATTLSKAELLPHLDDFASALDRSWTEHTPDVVHLHSWLSALAVPRTTPPRVQSFHGLRIAEDTAGASGVAGLERRAALAADHVIAASSEETAALARHGVPKARVTLVPWGVDTGLFTPDGMVAPRARALRVLALGEVAPHSGFDTAITALSTVPDAEMLIVGPIRSAVPQQDPEVVRLMESARALGVAHRVRFTDRVPRQDLPALLRSADAAVCVPTREPTGTSALQAMACGVPLIAATAGALPDLALDGLTGVFVPPRDPTALGHALRGVLTSPLRRQISTITSVDRVQARFAWDHVVTEFVHTYRTAAGHDQDDVADAS